MAKLTESIIKGQCTKELREYLPGYVVLRHEDRITSGHPDFSVTGDGHTTWIEGKFSQTFASKGIQELTMLRLAKAGKAIYVVWELDKEDRYTYIVHPRNIGDHTLWGNIRIGFDHKWLANWIRQTHQESGR